MSGEVLEPGLRRFLEAAPTAALAVSPEGEVVFANPAARQLFEPGGGTVEGRIIEDFVPARWRDGHVAHRQRFLQAQASRSMGEGLDLFAVTGEGNEFPAAISLHPHPGPAGTVVVVSITDLTELARARDAARAQAQALERSNRDLEDFAHVASHDLQEPLRKIRAFSDRLTERCAESLDPRGLDYLRRVQRSSQRMQRLIDDLLEFSRVGTRARPSEAVDLKALAEEVLEDLGPGQEGDQLVLRLDGLPAVQGEASQLRRLLLNLLSNARKFRAAGRPCRVEVRGHPVEGGRGVRLEVEDNGIGFEPEYARRIFSLFERLHGRDAYEGTGMGLAICRRITDRHGGEIHAHAVPGEGATFVVELPCAGPASTEEDPWPGP